MRKEVRYAIEMVIEDLEQVAQHEIELVEDQTDDFLKRHHASQSNAYNLAASVLKNYLVISR